MEEPQFLGQGSFGMAFTPAVECIDQRKIAKDTIGKVFFTKSSADTEYKINDVPRKLDPTQKLLFYPTSRCNIKQSSLPKIAKVIFRTKVPPGLQPDEYSQHLLLHGGTTLEEYMKIHFLKNSVNRATFIKVLEPLFYAVKLLNDNGYVHQDIKTINIVATNTKGLKLIDFGFLQEANKLFNTRQNFYLLDRTPPYFVSPPEYNVHKLEKGKFKLEDWNSYNRRGYLATYNTFYTKYQINTSKKHIDDFNKFLKLLKNLPKQPLKDSFDYMDEYKEFLSELKPPYTKTKDTDFKEYLREHIDKKTIDLNIEPTFDSSFIKILTDFKKFSPIKQFLTKFASNKSDIYSIGIVFCCLSEYIISEQFDFPEAVKLFDELVIGILNPSPIERLSIDEAIKIVRKIRKLETTNPYKVNQDPQRLIDKFKDEHGNLPLRDFDASQITTDEHDTLPPNIVINPPKPRERKPKEPKAPKAPKAPKEPKECPPGKVLNPKTGRCAKEKIDLENKPCPPGKVRHPVTKRCRKEDPEDNEPSLEVPKIMPYLSVNTPYCVKRSKLTLKEYQTRVCKHLSRNRGLLVFHSVGSGKSLTAVTASQCFLDANPDKQIVIVTPVSLMENFKKEMVTYGLPKWNKKAPNPNYVFFTHEGLVSAIKNNKLPDNYFDDKMIIVDEAHKFRTLPLISKGYTKADGEVVPPHKRSAYYMLEAAKKANRVVCLTATPIVNASTDLKNLLTMVTGVTIKKLPKDPESSDYNKFNGYISFYERDRNNPNYPSFKIINEPIEMTEDYYEKYLDIIRTLAKHGKQFTSKFWLSFRQAMNKLDNSDNSPKVNWIVNLILKGQKTLIYSSFLDAGVEYVAKRLKDLNIEYGLISGKNTIAQRAQTVIDFNTNKYKVLFITKAGGEGLDLKEVRNVVLTEPTWNPAAEEQIIGRAVRSGSHITLPKDEQNVTVYRTLLVSPNGEELMDHKILSIVEKKQEGINAITETLKRLAIENDC